MKLMNVSMICGLFGIALTGCTFQDLIDKPLSAVTSSVVSVVNSNREKLGLPESVKLKNSLRAGWVVVSDPEINLENQDIPYESFAINLKSIMTNPGALLEAYNNFKEDGTVDCGDLCVGLTEKGGKYKDSEGLTYEQADLSAKDLEAVQAAVDQINEHRLGLGLATRFGLSNEQGLRLSKAVTEWDQISKSRQMTERDVAALTSDLFGIDVATIKKASSAYVNGDQALANDLINKAADSLDTTPENLRRMFETIAK
jgi:hypothetical protein